MTTKHGNPQVYPKKVYTGYRVGPLRKHLSALSSSGSHPSTAKKTQWPPKNSSQYLQRIMTTEIRIRGLLFHRIMVCLGTLQITEPQPLATGRVVTTGPGARGSIQPGFEHLQLTSIIKKTVISRDLLHPQTTQKESGEAHTQHHQCKWAFKVPRAHTKNPAWKT